MNLTEPEKLMLLMLADIHEHLGIEDGSRRWRVRAVGNCRRSNLGIVEPVPRSGIRIRG
jgi:hypothetical protein